MAKTKADTRVPVAELEFGQRVEDDIYLIAQKDLRTTSNGGLYIHAMLADQSGQIIARMWNASREVFASMPNTGLMRFRGYVESYRGKPQFIIEGVRTVEPGEADPADFLPASSHDPAAMWDRVKEILRGVRDPNLLALLGSFLNDPDFATAFQRSPAARVNHHAYLGGLLEHTLSLMELGVRVLPHYPRVSSDLVLAGLFLHDAGKVAELCHDASFDYTSEGQLLGHLVQSVGWIDERARAIETDTGRQIPPDLLLLLKHIIVSHHGRYEFGSPKLPSTPEAIMVHYLDNLDAKLAMMFQAIDTDENADNDFTAWIPALEARIMKRHNPAGSK